MSPASSPWASLRHPMARSTGSLLVGLGGRVVLQAVYFLLLAHGLGVKDYGAFAGMLAVVSIISPFSTFGAINILIRDTALDPREAPSHFATTNVIAWLGGIAITLILVAASPLVLPKGIPVWAFASVVLSEALWARLIEVASAAFQGLHKMGRVARIQLSMPALRCAVAAALVLIFGRIGLGTWCVAYLVTSFSCAALVSALTRRTLGAGDRRVRSYVRQWRDGILFSVSLASQSVYNDIDKAMLSNLGSLSANGIYSAAYRIVEIGFAPMRAVLAAAYPRFFAHGAGGLSNSIKFASRLALPSFVVCLAGSVGLFFGADLIPFVLGSGYNDSILALRLLSILPLIRGCQYLAADALTGAGSQGARSIAQAAVAALNVALNIVLIPAFSWRGAVASTLICDGVLALALWAIIASKHGRRWRTQEPVA